MFKIFQEVSEHRIADVLDSALNGGSNYWYMIEREIEPKIWKIDKRPVYKTPEEAEKGINFHYSCYYPLNEGGTLLISDASADEPILKKPVGLDRDAIQKGLQVMAESYPSHFADIIKENDDNDTADVFLQCCIFGETVYG